MKQFNAAKSLFNSPERAKALSGMVGGQAREQTVLTPDWLLDAIRAVAPIGLDPCTTAENPVGADRFCSEEVATGLVPACDVAMGFAGGNGLEAPWSTLSSGKIVYVNPPYGDLKPWMACCFARALAGVRIYLLAPFRPQRRWFNEYTKGHLVVTLAPFPFKGHKSAFPAPLCLVCYNLPCPELGKYETARWRQL